MGGADVAAAVGLLLVAVGIGLVYFPAALIAVGLLVTVVAVAGSER